MFLFSFIWRWRFISEKNLNEGTVHSNCGKFLSMILLRIAEFNAVPSKRGDGNDGVIPTVWVLTDTHIPQNHFFNSTYKLNN